GLLEPHAQHLTLAVQGDRQSEVAGLALHRPAVADLEHERVEEQDRVEIIQRPLLPGLYILQDGIGDPADQIPPHRDSVELAQVSLDIPRREPTRVERQDLLVEPLKAPLALSHQPRLKAPVTIPRRPDLDRPMLRAQRLGRRPVARVPRAARRLLMALIAEMVSELDLERPLHQPLGQLREHPAGPDDLL